MLGHSKRYNSNFEKINRDKEYSLEEAAELLSSFSHPKFDESVELAINLGVDPKHADQIVRGTVALPNGIGKDIKVLVFARDDLAEEAKNAGADFVGADDMVEKVKGGWTDIDVVVAAPDMMAEVGKLGKILGPRGLMPNPKIGTVTKDIAKAVTEVKAGKIEFRVEKNGIIHNIIGKVSFSKEKIVENAKVFVNAILKAKPQATKGVYMKKVTMTSTMGPGIKLDKSSISG
ncbi:MAG TPA: 50S ribosomal protein L1 [Candidatus Marinimicrobia bacterium]|nr:50S ribosomal protein L1 [Candidatus Neomarinimicrobiota bacterium]HIG50833.1 50S ribosomal protein L1 [Candidatus Neomarinimicrobiota bacterium]HIM53636.1 50S ribosomal protein L1 [Candidatus Neomarinimicrobiota bacterium]